jgi:hypothetical protein
MANIDPVAKYSDVSLGNPKGLEHSSGEIPRPVRYISIVQAESIFYSA